MSLFSKKNLSKKPNKYNITKKDMVGELKGFPVGIVVRMMEEQEAQGNEPDVTIFQKNRMNSSKGFIWDKTIDGQGFWYKVINFKDFNLFFERYPEYEIYN